MCAGLAVFLRERARSRARERPVANEKPVTGAGTVTLTVTVTAYPNVMRAKRRFPTFNR